MNKIYVIVDMQNDFIYGRLGTEQSPIAFRNLAKRFETIPINSYVFFTQDTHFDDYLNTYEGVNLPIAHCVHATWGWQIPEILLYNLAHCNPDNIKFRTKSAFGSEELLDDIEKLQLRQIDEIEICGLCTDMCVITNALLIKTRFPDVLVSVNAKCCAGSTPELHQSALDVMKACHIKIIE